MFTKNSLDRRSCHGSGAKEESLNQDLPLADLVDPDVLVKSYQLPVDQAFAKSQQPERWLQAYGDGSATDLPVKTDEEFQTETRWMYTQVFHDRGYDRQPTENAITRILVYLNEQKLELLYIVEHLYWKASNCQNL